MSNFGDELGDWIREQTRAIPDEVALTQYSEENPPPEGQEWYISERSEASGKIGYDFSLRPTSE